ncbi:MAG TPA: cob(I)yrinic acid a,c-diamide adenosyltransferase [Candidatus Paceibacterota bacterium]|jgi:cob(I)alamin adenosyltransferase|nr:cob(I)yrinic acid a,c-diamide adenosyltransferase [Candidatus Paceibacterota bacterium]
MSGLYTGKGDGGTTKTFEKDQPRISKASEMPEALGTLDELNSFLGLARNRAKQVQDSSVKIGKKGRAISQILRDVQETLFIVQAEVAGAPKKVGKAKVTEVEKIITAIELEIPPIVSFSISGGTEVSALLDVARTLARRAERRVVGVHELGLRALSPNTRAYLNRLSSLLFALARFANHASGIKEENPKYK